MKREFKILGDREHCLARPAMYIGSITMTDREMWLLDTKTNTFSFKSVSYVPGLAKCIDEIIDNCIDVAIESNFKIISKISVEVADTWFRVIDNGPGIPVAPPKTPDPKKRLCPEIAWTVKQAGTSFSENRKGPSANGVGSTCVNIFSKKFIGISDDGKEKQRVECSNNMANIKASEPMKSSGKSGVEVYVEPDLARFGLEKITDEHKSLIYQRLVNLAICFPKLKFFFNKKQIRVNEKNFASMFSENAIVASSDNATIVVFPNEYDEFKQYSYVNGLNCIRGGTQVDYVANEICTRVKDKLVKKYKSIRPGDVKNKLCIVVFLTDFANALFDAQTKELLSNSVADIRSHFGGKIDFDLLAKQILKSEAIISPIVETFKIKEELKSRQELKKSKKIHVKSDKYMAPIGERKYLFLCEGQSATSSLCSCIGRNGCGFYSLRGLPINALENSMQKLAANQEFKDVMSILDLDVTKNADENSFLSFEKVIIATDQDLDGIHLTSMLIGWFRKFAPSLFKKGKICKLQTPLVIVKDSKDAIKEYFFDLESFKRWEEKNKNTKLNIIYQKGLGSIERSDISWLMSQQGGLEKFLYSLDEDADAFKNVDLWLTGDAEPRKEKLRQYTLDINLA